jgi:hypothetical protein
VPVLEANKGDNGAAGEQFLADMDAYFQSSGDEAAAPERRKGTTVNGWMSVRAVEQVAKKLPEVTRDSVLKGFSSTTDMSFPGLLFTTIDFTKPQPVPTLARLFDSVYKAYVWDASKKSFSTDDKPLDIIKLLTGQK